MVCWLEISVDFKSVPKGFYDVIFRMNIPTISASNFDCVWTVKYTSCNGPAELIFKHEKRDRLIASVVGGDWKLFNLGSIHIEKDGDCRIHLLGGNNHWFNDLELDYVQLRPIPEEHFDKERKPVFIDS